MKIVWGNHRSIDGYPDPIHHHITKETYMSIKRKTIVARAVRTLAATAAGVLAGYLAGPHGVDWLHDAQAQSFVVMVIVPVLVTADKLLRYGSEPGEE